MASTANGVTAVEPVAKKVKSDTVVVIDGDDDDKVVEKNSNGKRPLEATGATGADSAPKKPRSRPRSFAVHVDTVENMQAAEAEGNVPKKLGESPALLKTKCVHEVSLPTSWGKKYDEYDFSAPITETLGGEAVSKEPAKEYKFNLDAFQRESIKCLERRESVLVAAHTSAGKTAVAEYAIAMSLRDKQRVIYTSPIKALSNQKFRELEAEFSDVGLMTGDVTINKNASCLVMTTEILRSMLYRGSEVVREVAWVIFDEVHYMRDKDRGVVWEEAIILVPKNVRFVFLSATIPNAKQFSEWIAHLKSQPCHTIYTDTRPVPLQHYMFPGGGEGLHLVVDDKGQFRTDAFEKVLAELKDVGNESGGRSGDKKRNRNMRTKQKVPGKSDAFKVVKMIKERSLYPTIVFSFSKRDTEAMAMQMQKLDFNDEEEQELVEKVYQNAIASLDDEDQTLPQIRGLLPILKRGVGIHHSGLLPIAKEIVELLFGEGLVKALFATETFAMGLNMPAKTVVFSSYRKFDGNMYRHLSSGEYVQMSGRAGRRGTDAQGIAILMCDEKLEAASVKQIMSGTAEPLTSTFHLGYNMLLNLLRAEEADPEFVIARSLAQYQADQLIPGTEEKIKQLKAKIEAVNVVPHNSTLVEKDISDYLKLHAAIEKYKGKIRVSVNVPKVLLKFLNPGRVVKVYDRVNNADYGWGAVTGWIKKSRPKSGGKEDMIVNVLCRCKVARVPAGQKPLPIEQPKIIELDLDDAPNPDTAKDDDPEWKIVPCAFADVDALSIMRVMKPDDMGKFENRRSVGEAVREVVRRFGAEKIPLLDPVKDMGITDEKFIKTVKELETLQEFIKASPVHESHHRSTVLKSLQKKKKLADELKETQKTLRGQQGLILKEELGKMKRVLRRLGFITEEDVVEVKGRVGCEVNTANELVLTEFLLGGNMNEMAPEILVAVLSCFVIDEGKKDENLKLEKELEDALEILRTVAKRVGTVMHESGIPTNVEEFVEKFNPCAMRVVHQWCLGKNFEHVCTLSDIFEGSVVRCMRRLEELLRQLVSAAKSIGNSELEEKFEGGSQKLKRGIAFHSSLYT